jgi:endonuclease-3 related protein
MPRLFEQADDLLMALRPLAGPIDSAPPSFERLALALLDRADDRWMTSLTEEGLGDVHGLASADPLVIAEASGGKLKSTEARLLQRLAQWLLKRHRGHVDDLSDCSTETLREELRQVPGVGEPTADRVLLVGLGRPTVPVERGAYRVALRHGWLDTTADYDESRSVLTSTASDDVKALRLLDEGLREVARKFCRVARPRCEDCPLAPLLGPEGPVRLDEAE